MTRWAMTIDLSKCIGCRTCKSVCTEMNNIPPNSNWRRIVEQLLDHVKNERLFVSMGCMHCDNPPCLKVCPTKATIKRNDGIVFIDQNVCMGCGACVLACPYMARSISELELFHANSNLSKPKSKIGTCTKCDFCRELIDRSMAKNLSPGIDDEATPVCVRYCISDAMSFGDIDDPNSEVSKLIKDNETALIRKDLETDPCVFYIVN